ncbi:outer membrane protein assembly factor BamA [Inmirania thermothiophila]|nr:outer membrane protein assembly factor BamA [Inmirania thermothiophila]
MRGGSIRRSLGWLAAVVLLVASAAAGAFEPFRVEAIRVEGNVRITEGTVFSYLPVQVGDRLDEEAAAGAIRALFRTGFFEDVRLERDGATLVVVVRERPAIGAVEIEGNRAIPTDELKKSLKDLGLAEGRVFDRSLLERIRRELERQYLSQGKYAARIETEVEPLERNRVAVRLRIREGEAARIRAIRILGNRAFTDEALLDRFQLGPKGPFAWFSKRDQYSRQRLAGDLETLRAYYMDRGYVEFAVDSTVVTLTPDRGSVFITIRVREGGRYRVGRVRVVGETVVPREELEALLTVAQGEVFSQRAVTESADAIAERLGVEGFAFANVNPVPELHREAGTVDLTFFVDPGKRVYVRRVEISGNTLTRDAVIRRELRQPEGAPLSTEAVRLSRTRLQRLGFFEEVNVETPRVPGSPDLVDVRLTVKERPTGNLIASVGYSDTQGVIFSGSVSEDNLFGRGTRLKLQIDNSSSNRIYSLAYDNPYYTLDGVSRGFSLNSRRTDAAEANVSDYSTDVDGAEIHWGVPVTEEDRLRFGIGAEATRLHTFSTSPQEILDFAAATGSSFTTYRLELAWTHDSRDRAFFATTGLYQRVGLELAVPGSDLTFYKLAYDLRWYRPLTRQLTFVGKLGVAFGDGYGDTASLPFFEHFFAGGVRSVRGFDGNSLGPRDSTGDPFGGNLRVVTNLELVLPLPGMADNDAVRVAGFVDVGNVFDTDGAGFDPDALRASAGVALNWFSPIGPLIFSWATPLRSEPGDETQSFQFSLGFAF